MLDYNFNSKFNDNGYSIICGVDEAGRGPLAGPVIAAAVILPEGCIIEGLDDSKKISPKKREKLYDDIISKAVSWSAAQASVEEIEEINILNAAMLAMKRAVDSLSVKPDLALIDGNISRGMPIDSVTVVKGDSIVPCIAAASIIAKVTRDRLCLELDAQYPEYNFKKHKGYPTKEHRELLIKYGASPVHRKSFLKFMYKDNKD